MNELVEINLLLDFAELDTRLVDALEHGSDDPSDAFLLACGLSQIVDDYLQRDVLSLSKVAGHVPPSVGRLVRALRSVGFAVRDLRLSERRVRRFRDRHAAVVQACADTLALGTSHDARHVRARLPRRLKRDVQRLPNCFRSFDQRPEDCARLVELLGERTLEREQPLLVVGVRTSGSYLAPLYVSYLRAAGFVSVRAITFRPSHRLLRSERRCLRETIARAGLVLVVDDPPRTGSVLARVAAELERLGAPRPGQVLLVPLFGSEPPEAVREHDLVSLPWEEWAVHARLRESGVREEAAPSRGHARGRTDKGSYARGVGFGYLGRYATAVAARLGEFLPRVDGIEDGVLYREWLPEESRVERADREFAAHIGRYVGARADALRVDRDPTPLLSGRDCVWEEIASLFGACFGRARLAVRPLVRRAGRRLAATARPSVIDGEMKIGAFFALQGGDVRKVSFEDSPFTASGLGAYSFDPLFDAAGVTAAAEIEGVAAAMFADAVRRECERATGGISDERWLLYQLVHHAIARHAANGYPERLLAIERATSRAVEAYFSPLVRGRPLPDGPLCAVDVDGVLETRLLAAPALGPDGALALRALTSHGFRPVLVTGRCLSEVIERCHAYGLAGGAAAYGAAVYDALSGETKILLTTEDVGRLASVRTALRDVPGVFVDPRYAHSVRAYREESDGSLGALLKEQAATAIAAAVGGVRAIPGDHQTDFVAGIDKGDGVAALCDMLGAPLAMAVGDSDADAPMLRSAQRPFVPAHAASSLPGRRTRRSYQAGLREACAEFLGHRRCSTCVPPRTGRDARWLFAALRAKDGGASVKLAQAVAFAAGMASR